VDQRLQCADKKVSVETEVVARTECTRRDCHHGAGYGMGIPESELCAALAQAMRLASAVKAVEVGRTSGCRSWVEREAHFPSSIQLCHVPSPQAVDRTLTH
jgi:hypothetical protein